MSCNKLNGKSFGEEQYMDNRITLLYAWNSHNIVINYIPTQNKKIFLKKCIQWNLPLQ